MPREVVSLFLGNLKEEMAGVGAALTDNLKPRARAARLTVEQSLCYILVKDTLDPCHPMHIYFYEPWKFTMLSFQ